MSDWRLVRVGDASIVVEFAQEIDPAINARALAVGNAVRAARHPGVRDVVEGYCSVTVVYDPLRTALEPLVAAIEEAAERAPANGATEAEVELPVCYGGRHGPDLEAVAVFAGCSPAEVAALHHGATYRVYMLGFLPGFAYMGSVDPRIAVPRRSRPRLRVPAGSVGIARFQTGVYPLEAPGGWHLIGRCPLKTFDPGASNPFLLQPGCAVRFVPITEAEYRRVEVAPA